MAARKRPKRAKPGPKPLPASKRRRHVLSLRLTDAQLEAYRAAAGQAEKTLVDWAVAKLDRGLKVPRS